MRLRSALPLTTLTGSRFQLVHQTDQVQLQLPKPGFQSSTWLIVVTTPSGSCCNSGLVASARSHGYQSTTDVTGTVPLASIATGSSATAAVRVKQ